MTAVSSPPNVSSSDSLADSTDAPLRGLPAIKAFGLCFAEQILFHWGKGVGVLHLSETLTFGP